MDPQKLAEALKAEGLLSPRAQFHLTKAGREAALQQAARALLCELEHRAMSGTLDPVLARLAVGLRKAL